jgi:hypothetical protein
MEKGRLFARILIGLIVFIYVIAPDLLPGPIDDAVMIMLGVAANNKLKIPKDDVKIIDVE